MITDIIRRVRKIVAWDDFIATPAKNYHKVKEIVHIPVKQYGITKFIFVRTKRNGGM